jgi:hypothetical protein
MVCADPESDFNVQGYTKSGSLIPKDEVHSWHISDVQRRSSPTALLVSCT